MAKTSKEKSYWPHMILGFLILGVTLSYWTVKSASSIPVAESNEYMMKYQQADMNINEIMHKKARFDQQFAIEIVNAEQRVVEIENAKRAKGENAVILHEGKNTFYYRIKSRDNKMISDANVTFLLTRPHTVKDDVMVENVPAKEGKYVIEDLEVRKPGRYILQLKAVIDENTIGYSEIPGYLKP